MPPELEPAQAAAEPTADPFAGALAEIESGLGLTPEEPAPEAPEAAPAAETAPPADSPSAAAPAPAAEGLEPAKPEIKPVATVGEAPSTWRKEAKEQWAAVPEIVREELVKREQDIMRYVEQTKGPAGIGQTFEKIISPHLEMMAQANINVFDNYRAMLDVQKVLMGGSPQQKLAVLGELAKASGLQLDGTQLSAPAGADQQYVAHMEARLAKLEGGVSNVASTVQNARINELSENIMVFLQDKVNHPYAEELVSDMTDLINRGFGGTLRQVYEQAVMANPVTRQKYLDAETERRIGLSRQAESDRAAQARKASGANVVANGSRRTPPPAESLDDTLTAGLAAIRARETS